MKYFSLAFFILVFGLSVFAQVKKTKPKPKAKPPVVKQTPAQTPEPPKTSTVQIEAAVIFQNGDVVPVARNTFYLLSEDLEKIINTPEMRKIALDDAAKFNAKYNTPNATQYEVEVLNRERLPQLLQRAKRSYYETYSKTVNDAITKTVKFQVVSDFQGKAEFKDIPKGTYFLFSQYEIRKAFVVWHILVESKGETIKVILDSNNRLQ